MKHVWRATLAILLAFLVFEIIVIAPHYVKKSGEFELNNRGEASVASAAPVAANRRPAQIMHGVHLIEAKAEAREWELWADSAVRPQNDQVWRIQNVKIRFFKNNHVAFTVHGDQGEVNEAVKDVSVWGHVVTQSSNGYMFETDRLHYQSQSKQLATSSHVKMFSPSTDKKSQFLLTGQGMTADLKTNLMRVLSHVVMHKRVRGNRMLIIHSQNAEFSGVANYAKFKGQVVMDVDSARITGPEAEFLYVPGTDQIQSVVVNGGAHLTDSDKWATASTVVFDLYHDKFIFEGNPRLVQNDDELVGDTIVFSHGGKQVDVINARAKVDKNGIKTGS